MKKAFWFVVLIVSFAACFVLISAPAEVYLGIDMPFVTISHSEFTFYGYDIAKDQQEGFMLGMGLLLMLPARTIHLALIKLTN